MSVRRRTGDAPALIVTGVPWRTGWRYRERGYRHIYWDAGTMLSQLLAAAESAGVTAHLHSRFPDQAVAALVGADGVHEWPVAVVGLGDGHARDLPRPVRQLRAGWTARRSSFRSPPPPSGRVTRTRWGPPGLTASRPTSWCTRTSRSRPSLSLAGRNASWMPARRLPADLLRTSLGAALRGITVPHWIAVHHVDGLAPGLYRWPDLDAPVRAGDLRDELYKFCLDQGLGRDAAFVVIAAADLGDADDHEYREAQLAAGLAAGRLHLLAYALGASASGMTFADSLLPELLGEPFDGLLVTCVGVPEYASAAGGQPGSPTSVGWSRPGNSG